MTCPSCEAQLFCPCKHCLKRHGKTGNDLWIWKNGDTIQCPECGFYKNASYWESYECDKYITYQKIMNGEYNNKQKYECPSCKTIIDGLLLKDGDIIFCDFCGFAKNIEWWRLYAYTLRMLSEYGLFYKKYEGKAQFNVDDLIFHGRLQDINDIISFEGATYSELKKDFIEGVKDYLEACASINKEPEMPNEKSKLS
jgi:hypothetical protein